MRLRFLILCLLTIKAIGCDFAPGAEPQTAIVNRPAAKPFLTIYWADWCTPCHLLASDLNADPDFAAALHEKYCWKWVNADPTGLGRLVAGLTALPTFVGSNGISITGYGDRNGLDRKTDLRRRLGLRPAQGQSQPLYREEVAPTPPTFIAPPAPIVEPADFVTREQHTRDLGSLRGMIEQTERTSTQNDNAIIGRMKAFDEYIKGRFATVDQLDAKTAPLVERQQEIEQTATESKTGLAALGEKIAKVSGVVHAITDRNANATTATDEKPPTIVDKVHRVTGLVSLGAKVFGYAVAPQVMIPLDIGSSVLVGALPMIWGWFRRRKSPKVPSESPEPEVRPSPPAPADVSKVAEYEQQLAQNRIELRSLKAKLAAMVDTGRPDPRIAELEDRIAVLLDQQERQRLEFVRLKVPDPEGECYRESLKRVAALHPAHGPLFAQVEGVAQQLMDGKRAAKRGVALEQTPGWKSD